MKYLSSKTVTQILGVTAQTLRNWDREGKLKPSYVKGNGYRYYSEESILAYTQERKTKKNLNVIAYIRADSEENTIEISKQESVLKEFLDNKYDEYSFIKDFSTSFDCKRAGLLKLIEMINRKEVDVIVILNKPVLLGFGFELIEEFASLNNVKIEILERTKLAEGDKALINDLVSTANMVSNKLGGKHKQIIKTNLRKMSDKLITLANKE